MSDPQLPGGPLGEPLAEPASPPREETRQEVFWGYAEVFLFVGLTIPAMLAAVGLVRGIISLFRLHPIPAAEALAHQLVLYVFLFLILLVVFRAQYGRSVFASLGWRPMHAPPFAIVTAGWLVAFAVVAIGYLLRTPTESNPLTELMQDRLSLILVAAFGVTLGPVAEELAFRGFLQPLLARSFGAVLGIVLTSIPFGLLHAREYGYSWRHVVLVSAAGAAFGWMRHATGSTKASSLMHSAYNAIFFVALWSARRPS
jgi:membrane protease YdiL (CAAX protease family)